MRSWLRSARFLVGACTLCSGALLVGPGCSDDAVAIDEGEDPTADLGGPARGIDIVGVEANQGTAVMLTEGAAYIAAEDRNAFLVRERDTLIRFQHRIHDPEAWVPRELTGALHIILPDGEEVVRLRTLFIEADSDPRNLLTNFYFSLLADEAQIGAQFWLELRETDPSFDQDLLADLDEGVNVAPTEAQPLGFEDTDLRFEVVLVPVDYRGIEPPTFPDITEEDVQLLHDHLLQQNPVQSINITIRDEPMVWDEQLTNLGDLLGPTRALKEADAAAANVYYHSLVDVGGPSVNMVAGIANFADDTMDESGRRVAATVYYKRVTTPDDPEEEPVVYPPTASARTFVHEIGHNQGLRHVECPGADAAGPDPDYPYDDGKIGGYGFGIRDFHMYTPTASHDYMSYCGNSWVSDWTWNKTFARIELLTSWDSASAVRADPEAQILVGTLYADGSETWWIHDGVAPAPERRSAAQTLEFWADGERVAIEYAQVERLSDDQTIMVTAPLPPEVAELDGLDAITRVDLGARARVDLDLDAIHVGRRFAARQP